jgi:hypothetical protein
MIADTQCSPINERDGSFRIVRLIAPIDCLADRAGLGTALDRLKDRYPTADVTVHRSAGGYGVWWRSLLRLLPDLDCLATYPRSDGSIGKGCADALGEALERGIPCVVATRHGISERFVLIRGRDGSYHDAAVVLPELEGVTG